MRQMTKEDERRALEEMRVNSNPRLVWMVDYAIEQIMPKLARKHEFPEWASWALTWKAGQRQPQRCVDIAHLCFDHHRENNGLSMGHALGQIAWAAKEACYSNDRAGWYVMFYLADAMIAFGIAYPKKFAPALEAPTLDEKAIDETEVRRLA